MSTDHSTVVYRPGLDGVRALAVIAVLLFHLDRLPGGYLGVDAFFVVSGWLITWKLLDQVDRDGQVDVRRFWAARARRIMPASVAVLVAIAVVWPIVGIEVTSLRRDIVWAAGWMSNWGTISGGGDYWARFGELSPVTHFWSLAIEEQFYLVWPLLIAAVVWGSRRHRLAVGVCSALGVIGSIVVMNIIFDPANPTATYMNTFARAHNLLIGATAAAFTTVLADGHVRGAAVARRLAPVGAIVAAIIVARSSAEATWMFQWGFPVFALALIAVVVAAADGAGSRVLASAPLRWIGERSYGLYLWHWPVFLLLSAARLDVPDSIAATLALDLVRVAVAVLLADLSFRLLETPIRRKRRLLGWRAPVAATTAFATLAVLAFVVVPSPVTPSEASNVTLAPAPVTSFVPSTVSVTVTSSAPSAGTIPSATTSAASDVPVTSASVAVTPDEPRAPLRVLVSGDSTGVQLAESLIEYAVTVPDQLIVGSAASAGCGLSAGSDGRLHEFTTAEGERDVVDLYGCLQQWESIPQRVIEESVDSVVVNIGPWDSVDIQLADGSVVSVGDTTGRQLITDAYQLFVESVRRTGATVVWVTPADTHLGWGNIEDPLNDPARWIALRAIIDELDVVQIDLAGWLQAQDLEGPDGRPDGVHLAPALRDRFIIDVVAPVLAAVRAERSSS